MSDHRAPVETRAKCKHCNTVLGSQNPGSTCTLCGVRDYTESYQREVDERLAEFDAMKGVEQLRYAVTIFNSQNETFNYRFDAADIMKLARAVYAGEWCIPATRWTDRQINRALRAKSWADLPEFNDDETPRYRAK